MTSKLLKLLAMKLLWRVTHHIAKSNKHQYIMKYICRYTRLDGSLISSTNGFINFINSVIINNSRYKIIIRLYVHTSQLYDFMVTVNFLLIVLPSFWTQKVVLTKYKLHHNLLSQCYSLTLVKL